jgi:hypothetical protein
MEKSITPPTQNIDGDDVIIEIPPQYDLTFYQGRNYEKGYILMMMKSDMES